MKKLLLLIVLFAITTPATSQACYQFGIEKRIRRTNVRNCYNFNDGRYSRVGALKIGVGLMPFELADEYSNQWVNAFMEMDYGDWGGGIQWDARSGPTYISQNILSTVAPVSIDSRIYGFFKPNNKNISIGGYGQLNSTNMWIDGWVFGGFFRLAKDWEKFGIYAQTTVPAINRQRRLVRLGEVETLWYWFGIPEDRSFESVRLTEYRLQVGIYLRLEHKIFEFKRR